MDEFNSRLNEVYKLKYGSDYNYDKSAFVEEMIADAFADLVQDDSAFFDYCMNKRPTVIGRIIEFLNRIINKLRRIEPECALYAAHIRGFMLERAAEYKAAKGIENRLSGAARETAVRPSCQHSFRLVCSMLSRTLLTQLSQ